MGRKGGMSELLEVVSGLPKATSALWCSASKQHREPSATVSKHGYFYYRRSVITHRLRDSPQVSCIFRYVKVGSSVRWITAERAEWGTVGSCR